MRLGLRLGLRFPSLIVRVPSRCSCEPGEPLANARVQVAKIFLQSTVYCFHAYMLYLIGLSAAVSKRDILGNKKLTSQFSVFIVVQHALKHTWKGTHGRGKQDIGRPGTCYSHDEANCTEYHRGGYLCT